MPPTIPPASLPHGRGDAAREYLATQGLVAVSPPIRSSDYALALTDPFRYYLTRRLGLIPALSWSKALSRGSWFHKCLELDDLSCEEPLLRGFEESLRLREIELGASCALVGIQGESLRSVLSRESMDAQTARAWYEASSSVHIDETHVSWRHFLRRPYWRVLSREECLTAHLPSIGGHPSVIQPDVLLYHEGHHKVWVVDAKTTDEDPVVRMTSCPLEFQTLHYLHTLHELLRHDSFRSRFSLPPDVSVGGMIHIVVRKPDLVFGMKDRNFTDQVFVPSRGPNKGVSRLERAYHGEPVFSNFLSRVRNWYAAADEYTHLAKEFSASPPCNLSFTTVDFLEDEATSDYHQILSFLHSMATRTPNPNNFLRNPDSLRSWGSVSKYAPLYLLPVHQWTQAILDKGLIQKHRNEPTP